MWHHRERRHLTTRLADGADTQPDPPSGQRWVQPGRPMGAGSPSTPTGTAQPSPATCSGPTAPTSNPTADRRLVPYRAFPPDGSRIAFMSHSGADDDIYTANATTGAAHQTHRCSRSRLCRRGARWTRPSHSPANATIALASPTTRTVGTGDEPGEHHDIWLMDADGGNQRRVTPEAGQFVDWSPDGRYLLISGMALYVVRPDGTGEVQSRANGVPRALGGLPDWVT